MILDFLVGKKLRYFVEENSKYTPANLESTKYTISDSYVIITIKKDCKIAVKYEVIEIKFLQNGIIYKTLDDSINTAQFILKKDLFKLEENVFDLNKENPSIEKEKFLGVEITLKNKEKLKIYIEFDSKKKVEEFVQKTELYN